jgi:hexulose-6-phosphate isomerase
LEQVFKRLRAAHYDGLQLAMRATAADGEVNLEMSDAEVRHIRRAAKAHGLRCHSLMPQTGVSLASAKAAERRTCVKHFQRMLELAKGLGCENILCHPGHVAAETPYDAFYGWVVEGLRALAPAARKAGIPILLENVWNRFMYSPLEAKQILADVGSRAVGVYLDLGNIIPFGWPEQWIRMLGRRIGEVHIKDFRRQVMSGAGFVYPLMGDVDWVAHLGLRGEAGERGTLSAGRGTDDPGARCFLARVVGGVAALAHAERPTSRRAFLGKKGRCALTGA